MTITKDGNEINTGDFDIAALAELPKSLMDVPAHLRAGVSLAVQSAAVNVALLLKRRDHTTGNDKLALALIDALPPSLLNEWLGMGEEIGYGDYYQLNLSDPAVGPAVMFATLAALLTAGEADHPEVNISLAAWNKSAGRREPMPSEVSEYIMTILTAAGVDCVYREPGEVPPVRQSAGGQDGRGPTVVVASTSATDVPELAYKGEADSLMLEMRNNLTAEISALEAAATEVTAMSSDTGGSSSGGGSDDTNWVMVGAVVVAGVAALYGAHQFLSEGETEDVVIVDLDNSW